ncbi:ComEC/Rec2 family competence protein [Shimia sp. SDUM112013]|uniref:ComEC/Rec2 family competence protein n=1 Tax=Shimia sp. SDUM112013 TaxID=3136160 RepID=UPI0032EFB37D
MRIFAGVEAALLGQSGHLFAWAPVFLGIGVGAYFALPFEPGFAVLAACAASGVICTGVAVALRGAFSPLVWAVALVCLGLCLAAFRAHLVQAPVLDWRYYGAVQGRIVGIDRSATDALRLTLADVQLENTTPDRTPGKVRVALHGEQGFITPAPGMVVMMTAHLSPPSGPVEPGGFDFQRHAWFMGIGAVGYTRTPVLTVRPRAGGDRVFAFRMSLSEAIQSRMVPDVAGVAAAITTGDRSGLDQTTTEALRASNLAHLLAISGLHMGLLAGVVFAAVRLVLTLVPPVALRLSAKKVAAVVALVAAAAYLLLSGGSVATQRAFVMAAVALCAILLDRRALSLRAVAMAALIILVLRPEALLGPGFQMSFAATTGLVAVFSLIRDKGWTLGPRRLRSTAALVVSSAVAGLATAPYAAAHFNVVAHYGLPANLLAMPIMGLIVAPAAVAAACLAPLGLEGVGLWAMEQGLRAILTVAGYVAALDGAQGHLPSPPKLFLPVFTLGMLWVILWQGRMRWLGFGGVLLAIVLWAKTDRPVILIADSGGIVGVMTPGGRALSKARGQGFVALNWLENDGDGGTQAAAAARWHDDLAIPILHLTGKSAVAAQQTCASDLILVTNQPLGRELPCDVYDPDRLRETGAIALHPLPGGTWQKKTAREVSGRRMWNSADLRWRQ